MHDTPLARPRPGAPRRSAFLVLLLLLFASFLCPTSAQTVTEIVTFTTGSASLNTPTRTPLAGASGSATRSTPQVTNTVIPDLQLSGPQVPFLLQKPIPSRYDDAANRVTSRMKDVYFTGCPADQVNFVDPQLRINVSAVYTQFDPDLDPARVLADQNQYSSGVLRIVAVGATDAQGTTVNTNVTPQLLSTLSVETQFLTFSIFRNDSYLCDSLYPTQPDPNGTTVNGVVIQPAGCLYGPGQLSLGLGIPLNDTYTLGTLWTRIRLSDTSSPPLDIACFEIYASPYDDAKWYWHLIFWFPVALTIAYFVLVALGRIFCALTSRARAFKNKAREGSQPNIINDTIAPTLVSSLTGQKLALSAALLRFATPGCWDIILHTQFVAAIAMIAVRWPEFAYPFLKQAAWSTLTGNVTLIRPAELDASFNLLATNASLPSGDISQQFDNRTSPLYMNRQADNRLLNLDGARAGMDAYAHAIGLRTRDLFGTCLAIWFLIVAAIVALSLAAWLVDSIHHTFLRLQKRREDGYDLDLATAPNGLETKEIAERDDDDQPRSSLSRRGGYRFIGTGRTRLFGASDNTFHLRMLHGNILRAVLLFHLPITIFTTYHMANADIFSATSVALAGLAFAFLSVLAPAYAVFCISRAPTAKLYDSIDTLAAFGPLYNTYSPGSQLFCAVDFARTFVLGVVIGAGQDSGSAQAIIVLVFEIMFALACGLWLPWGEGAMMGPVSFVANVLRVITAVLVLLLSPLVDFGREPVGWLTYVVLLIQAILYVCAALILVVKIVEGVVRLVGRASFDERASPRTSGLGGAIRKIKRRKETIQLTKKGKRLSQQQLQKQPLNRAGSTNTQTLMLASSTGENTPAIPSSPRRLSTSLQSTMSMNRMPMHSRQASYASYLDTHFQGRRSPADMLADTNSPYSTYLRGDPHDEGYIMAALPPTVASARASSSPPPQLHQWSGRQSPPPAGQSGFVRMGGGRASDTSPYQALHTSSNGLDRALSTGSVTAGPNERMSPTQQFANLPPQARMRPRSQSAGFDSYLEQHRRSLPPPAAGGDDMVGHSSTEAAARNATMRRYSQGAQLRASQSIAGMMVVDEEGQPLESAKKQKGAAKFWKRGGARSDSDSDDDDDDGAAGLAPYRSRGGWRGLNKMSAAMSSLAARLGAKGVAEGEEANTSLEPPASEADGSVARSKGFEVVRPQRPRRSSAGAERVLDSTAVETMAAPRPPSREMEASSSGGGLRRGVSSAADAYSTPASGGLDAFDAASGTLPPGAAEQALLLPNRSSARPASAVRAASASKPAVDEEMFWVSRPGSVSSSHKLAAAAAAAAAAAGAGAGGRESRQQVSTSSNPRMAEPMQAEVVDADESDDAQTPPMFDADGRLVEAAIDFDRPPAGGAASVQPQPQPQPRVWDAAQAYIARASG